jgi:hypothetical protein
LAGGVPGQGVVLGGVKGVKYSPKPPRTCKNGEKRRFPALIDLNIAKNTVILLKVLNKI